MIGYLLIAFGAVSALLSSWGYIEHTRAGLANARADAAETRLDTATKRATAMALLWAAELEKGGAALAKQQEEDRAKYAELEERASHQLPPGRVVVFSGLAGQLFTDVTHAANYEPAGPAAVNHGGAAAVPESTAAIAEEAAYDEREFAVYITRAGAAYNDARQKWRACVDEYRALQAREQHEGDPS